MHSYHSKWCELENTFHQHNLVLVPRPCGMGGGKITLSLPTRPGYKTTLSFEVWGPREWRRKEKECLIIAILELCTRFSGFSVGS